MSEKKTMPEKKAYTTPRLFVINPPGLEVPETLKFKEFNEEAQAGILGELMDIRQQLLFYKNVYPLKSCVHHNLLPTEFDKALFKLNLVLEILKRDE